MSHAFAPGKISQLIQSLMDQQDCSSERDFARKNNLPQPTVNQWLNECTPPSFKSMRKIAAICNTSLSKLIAHLDGEENAELRLPTVEDAEAIANLLSRDQQKELLIRLAQRL